MNEQNAEKATPLLTEVLTLSDEALIAFVDCIRLNSPTLTRDPNIVRRIFAAYVVSDVPPLSLPPEGSRS